MQLFKQSQFIHLMIFMTGLTLFPSQVYAQDLFYEYQPIPTHGAHAWESFTIGSDTFLAVANTHSDSTYHVDSKIYRWDGTLFVEYQSIPTQGACVWESFTIGSDTFLAVANWCNGSTCNIDSKIYKWDGSYFQPYQSILTHGAYDWESFTIGSDTFLAVANCYNGSTHNIDSKIYKWDGSFFVEIQSIPTQKAADWESFTIGSDTFLAVTNFYNDSTHNIDSKVYKYKKAKAGEDQIVYDSVTLDGSASFGVIVSWEWALIHQADQSNCSRTASGEIVTVDDLAPGFYHVTLTVTDHDGLSDRDEMILAAMGCKGDFDADGDVDGSDLAVFTANFGRTDCPICQ